MTEDKMVGWHHRLDGHEFEQTGEMVKDREALHVALHGVTKSQTQLKRLSGSNSSIQKIGEERFKYYSNNPERFRK